jgi:hypothetical protein
MPKMKCEIVYDVDQKKINVNSANFATNRSSSNRLSDIKRKLANQMSVQKNAQKHTFLPNHRHPIPEEQHKNFFLFIFDSISGT